MSPWLDFCGAPAMLIPRALVDLWRGSLDPSTGVALRLNTEKPRTDYDRACAAAWPGRGVLPIGQASALVIYSEYDGHAWMPAAGVIASGSWFPTSEQIEAAEWTDQCVWQVEFEDYLLLNSASDGKDVRPGDYAALTLKRGRYIVEFAFIEADLVGCFTRLRHAGAGGA